MISLKENASSHPPILLPQLISDAETGTGIIKNASAAQRDGHSISITSVYQLPINALPTLKMDLASHVTRVMISRMVPVFTQPSIMLSLLIQDVLPGTGITKSALLAQMDGSSIQRKLVYQYLINVLLTEMMVLVFHASRDTTSKKVPVFSQPLTMPSLLILDAPPGIGITKFALLAPNNGLSTLIKFVYPFLTNALLMPITEPVSHASRVMTLKKEPVSSLISTTLNPLTLVAPLGIGTIKSALAAQRIGPSMLIRFAFQFLTNVLLMPITVPVSHASRDTILRTELAFSHHSTTLSPLIQDAPPGIGIIKSALLALNNGFSMETRNVFQFPTNALLMLITETVFHASRDTTLRTEPVSSHPSTTPILPTLDVPPGIGTTKSASAAPRDGSSTQRRDACPLTTTATATTTVVPAPHASLGTL